MPFSLLKILQSWLCIYACTVWVFQKYCWAKESETRRAALSNRNKSQHFHFATHFHNVGGLFSFQTPHCMNCTLAVRDLCHYLKVESLYLLLVRCSISLVQFQSDTFFFLAWAFCLFTPHPHPPTPTTTMYIQLAHKYFFPSAFWGYDEALKDPSLFFSLFFKITLEPEYLTHTLTM